MTELECGGETGVGSDDFFRIEAELVLAQLSLRPGQGILDIGCGSGPHAFLMSDRLGPGVPISASDSAPSAIARAQDRLRARRKAGIQDALEFHVADMLEIGSTRLCVGAITCAGDSFGYHGNAEIHRILGRCYQVLEPGGRLILQLRERFAAPTPDMLAQVENGRRRLGIAVERREVDGVARTLFRDVLRGDAVYEVDLDCPQPDPAVPGDYTAVDRGGFRIWRDRDGWEHGCFSRCYVDPSGRSHLYPATRQVRTFISPDAFASTRRVLEGIGFRVRLAEGRPLGAHRNAAVVAERP